MTPPQPENLASYLQQLHEAAGRPSTRTIARATGIGHTRIHDYLRGRHGRANWARIEAVVAYLKGDPGVAQTLWVQLQDATTTDVQLRTSTPRPDALGDLTKLLTEIRDELRGLRRDLTRGEPQSADDIE